VLLYKSLRFDPGALEPVIIMARIPIVLVVRADFPASTVGELIAYAKANPGKITYGSQGIGTSPHLTAALFGRLTGSELTHIPYRGTAQVVNDLTAGHVDLLFIQLDAVRELWRAGKLKMLAVASDKRLDELPGIPDIAEAGVPDLRVDTWNAIAAPPKTPKHIVDKINADVNEALRQPELQNRLRKLSAEIFGGSPERALKHMQEETERWGNVIRAADVRLQ
jgi:tripartite-type tricarboxylate transporter receptor subunit TctC